MRYQILVLGAVVMASPLAAQGSQPSPGEQAERYNQALSESMRAEGAMIVNEQDFQKTQAKWAKLAAGRAGLWGAKSGNGDGFSLYDETSSRTRELPPFTLQVRYADEGELLRVYGALLDQTYAIDSVAGARMTSEAKQIFRDLRERKPKATVEAWMLALQPAIDDALDARTKWMTRALSPVVRATVIAKMEALTAEEYDAKYPALLATLYRAWSANPEAPAGSADSAVLAGLANNDN